MSSVLRILIPGLFAAALLAPAARAQALERPLTLQEAVRLALERYPEVLVAREQQGELEGRIQEVRAGAFPQLSVEGFGLRLRDPSFLNSSSFDKVPPEFRDALSVQSSNLFEVGVSLKQPLYTAGKVRTAIRLAEEGVREKEAALEMTRQRVAFRVFQTFHDVLLAQENLDLVRETTEQRRRHLEMARNRYAQGVATRIDVLRSEVNLSNLDPERIRAENQVRLATAALANLIMIGMDVPIRVEGKLERRPWSPGPLSELEAHALEVRPDLVVARRQLDEARLLLSLARAENKLSVDLESRFGYSVRNPENIMRYDFARWNLTVNFRLPFYDSGRKAGLVTQAIARVRVAEHNLAQLENAVRLEIKTAHSDLLSADESFSAAGLNIVQAQKVLVMMQANYQYGAATTLDVVDSQTALTLARNSQISAAYGYEVAKAGLRLAAGMPILGEEERP